MIITGRHTCQPPWMRANNWVQSTGVLDTELSTRWTMSSLAPTAANGMVTGRITDAQGRPVEGAVVRLSGAQNRKFITDANGNYRFDECGDGRLLHSHAFASELQLQSVQPQFQSER